MGCCALVLVLCLGIVGFAVLVHIELTTGVTPIVSLVNVVSTTSIVIVIVIVIVTGRTGCGSLSSGVRS